MIFLFVLIGCILYASLFEYILHRYVMHRPIFGFTYAFNAHAKVHHGTYKADHTYHVQDHKLAYLIPMAWWNGPTLIIIASTPFLLTRLMYGVWWPTITVAATLSVYYGLYEYLHWCMHLPKERILAKSRIFRLVFRRLNGHHLLHHRYMQHKNFNVVLPFWDFVFGTLVLRAATKFAQAKGPLVPDVQPKTAPKTVSGQ